MRTINAPGIELHEIDASQYNVSPDSYDTTAVLIAGFADKGNDYERIKAESLKDFTNIYGYPTNEAERYFFNAAKEVFSSGNNVSLYAAKLPYDNKSLNKVSYSSYTVLDALTEISSFNDFINTDLNNISAIIILTESNEISCNNELIYSSFYNFVLDKCDFFAKDLYNVANIFNNISCFYNLSSLFSEKYSKLPIKNPNSNIEMILGSAEYIDLMKSYTDIYHSMTNVLVSYDLWTREYLKTLSIDKLKKICMRIISDNNSNSVSATSILEKISNPEYTFSDIKDEISSICFMTEIKSGDTGLKTFDEYDSLITGESLALENEIIIINKTRSKYDADPLYKKDYLNEKDCNEYIGITPVITTAMNALRFQGIVSGNNNYSSVGEFQTIFDQDNEVDFNKAKSRFSIPLKSINKDDISIDSLALKSFPPITYVNSNDLDKTYLKKIGIVVFKMFYNSSNGKIDFIPVESFVGSLNKKEKNIITNKNDFIDDVVNTTSKYISVFSNVNFDNPVIEKSPIFSISNQTITSLGFYFSQCEKKINIDTSILKALDIILANAIDKNTMKLDIIIDAGVSNIAQYIESTKSYAYDPNISNNKPFKLTDMNSTRAWRVVIQKMIDFCQYTRGDCMFIADGLRNLCLDGNSKIIRRTRSINTVKNSILPKIKFITGFDSSYAAGYCNWFLCKDEYSRMMFWCPPSIKALGRYIYTDTMYAPWEAPAGMKRGVIPEVYDIAFNPTNEEAGVLYTNFWNYAMSYPMEGIILEGQRTFQKNQTAFDRINVRRLFLYVEKRISLIAKYFIYENISLSLLERFSDLSKNVLNDIVNGFGIQEYVVICDERNNNADTVENNEIHCTIAIRPYKTAEFIVLNFLCANQTANLEELTTSIV